MSSSSSKILPPFRPLDGKSYFVKMNDFVLSLRCFCFLAFVFKIIAFANEKKGTNVEEKFAANEKKGNKQEKVRENKKQIY